MIKKKPERMTKTEMRHELISYSTDDLRDMILFFRDGTDYIQTLTRRKQVAELERETLTSELLMEQCINTPGTITERLSAKD